MFDIKMIDDGIFKFTINGEITKETISKITKEVDSYLQNSSKVKGIMIKAEDFKYWDSFSTLVSHIKFVKGHEKFISKVALISDVKTLDFIGSVVKHFVSADVKVFSIANESEALDWVLTKDGSNV